MELKDEQNKSVFSGVMLGYLVLILHILLMVGLGATVVLIKGIYDFRWIIFVAGIALLIASAYYFYHKFKEHKQKIVDLMSDPAFRDKTLEISLMGGMASIKLGNNSDNLQLIHAEGENEVKLLATAPKSALIKELSELNRMLDDGLITRDEFIKLKHEII